MMFDFLSHVTVTTFIDGEKCADLFGGRIPTVGATVAIHRHKDTIPEIPDGFEFDEDGFCHLHAKVVDVEYDITIKKDSALPDRKANIRLESMA